MLALAGGLACSAGALAQESATPDSQPPWLERVLQALERVEAEQGALRQEIEALRVQREDSSVQGEDAVESENAMDPTILFEAGEEDPPEIARVLQELARLEAEQRTLRQEVETLWAQRNELPTPDPGSSASGSEVVTESRDELVAEDLGALLEGEEDTLASALDPGETKPLPEEKPVFSPKPYQPAVQLYERGREAFRNLNFYDAAKIFREFLTKYPAHEDAGEARYWLGEALYVEGRFQDAIGAFAEVIADDANPRREVARLKTGYAWFELDNPERAKIILTEVRDQNPGSDLARLAQLRLDRLQRRVGGGQ